ARTQQARWEGGRLALIRACALPLLRTGLRRRDLARLDAAAEIIVPPLSVIVLLVALCAMSALLLGWAPGLWLACGLLGTLIVHLAAGMLLARLSTGAYLSLLVAPLYMVWKCWVYAVALIGRGESGWVRTGRGQSQ